MIYEVMVTIENSPTKEKGWGYLINADNAVNAIIEALNRAKCKAATPRSRYKKCSFVVNSGDCIEKTNR